jgi:hypothetical protein
MGRLGTCPYTVSPPIRYELKHRRGSPMCLPHRIGQVWNLPLRWLFPDRPGCVVGARCNVPLPVAARIGEGLESAPTPFQSPLVRYELKNTVEADLRVYPA